MVQRVVNDTAIIGPSSVQEIDLIYPMPTWVERSPRPAGLTVLEQTFFSLAGISLVILAALIAGIFIYRRNVIVRGGQWRFLVVKNIGAGLIISSIFFWNSTSITLAGCYLRFWFLVTGFIILYGSLISKSFRILLLFGNKTMEIIKISDSDIFLILSGLLSIDWVLMVVWSIINSAKITVVSVDPFRPLYDYSVCEFTPVSLNFGYFIVFLNCIILLIGCLLAFKMRLIEYTLYNDTSYIAAGIYLGLLSTSIVIAVEVSPIQREVLFGIRSAIIILGAMGSILVLDLSKVVMMFDSGLTKPNSDTRDTLNFTSKVKAQTIGTSKSSSDRTNKATTSSEHKFSSESPREEKKVKTKSKPNAEGKKKKSKPVE